MALVASVIGGVAGYGTGALMPLVLVPIVGAEPVVPIIAISALFTNSSRAFAFRNLIDWRRVLLIVACALPTTMLGAWGYTMLTGARRDAGDRQHDGAERAAAPAVAKRTGSTLGDGGLAVASVLWGFVVGGTSGAGIILLSLLMAVGPAGRRRDRDRRGDLGRDRHRQDRRVRRVRRGRRQGASRSRC